MSENVSSKAAKAGQSHPQAELTPKGTKTASSLRFCLRAARSLLFAGPPPIGRAAALPAAMSFFGFLAGLISLFYVLRPLWLTILCLFFSGCLFAASTEPSSTFGKLGGGLAKAITLVVLSFFLYQATAFGSMLSWAVPLAGWAIVLTLLAASLLTAPRRKGAFRVPFVLPIGAWIAACIAGWHIEEGVARCNDYLEATSQPGVEVFAPSSTALATCRRGERMTPFGYPRKMTALGDDLLVTVDLDDQEEPDQTSPFTGGLCRVAAADQSGAPPDLACRDDLPRLYGLVHRPERSDVYVTGYMGVKRLRDRPPFETLATTDEDRGVVVNAAYLENASPEHVLAFYDPMNRVDVLDAETLQRKETAQLPIAPEVVRYDDDLGKGAYCFASMPIRTLDGRGYLALAFDSDPLKVRLLGSEVPWNRLAWTESCDIDPEDGQLVAGVSTLGLLAFLDLDSGELSRTVRSRFGMRPLMVDPYAERIYVATFLDGWLYEIHLTEGNVMRRWFVGRFVRDMLLHPDERTISITSTLGVLRVDLDGGP